MYKIVLKRTSGKELNNIEKKYKPRVIAALLELKNDPFLGKKLKGQLKECFSLRAWPYKIIYKVYKKDRKILIVKIGRREGIYK